MRRCARAGCPESGGTRSWTRYCSPRCHRLGCEPQTPCAGHCGKFLREYDDDAPTMCRPCKAAGRTAVAPVVALLDVLTRPPKLVRKRKTKPGKRERAERRAAYAAAEQQAAEQQAVAA